MDLVAALPSKDVSTVIFPTIQIFSPLLQAHSAAIKAICPTTHTYGPHPRQTLDVYDAPPTSTAVAAAAPILIFLYGGGLTRGDKIVATVPEGLVYHNVGTFFAQRGFTTIIPDYRRVNDASLGTGEGAVFPSGGEDVAAVLEWVESTYPVPSSASPAGASPASAPRDVFLIGNSGGGVHLSTFLLNPQFEALRKCLAMEDVRCRVCGAVLLSVPFHFKAAQPERSAALRGYYGDAPGGIEKSCPFGLLEALAATGEAAADAQGSKLKPKPKLRPSDFGIPPVLVVEGELDPVGEIVEPMRDFVAAWGKVFGVTSQGEKETGTGMTELVMKGHNHISPPVALMSGDRAGEEWGEDVVRWMRGLLRQ